MKIIPKQLKSRFKEKSFSVIVIAGLTFGLLASTLSHISSLISTVISWTLPLIAFIVGYYKVKTAEEIRSFSHRLSLAVRGNLLFILASSISSFVVNAIAITFGQGWGLSGVNIVTVAGIVSLILGVFVGILSQFIIFAPFGMIGGVIAGRGKKQE